MPQKVKKLKPIDFPTTLSEELELQVNRALTRGLYAPLLRLLDLKQSTIKNDANQGQMNRIGQALVDGTLTYTDGMFSGRLDASLTKALRDAGAIWDNHWGVFRLPEAELSPELDYLVRLSRHEYKKKMRIVDNYLAKLDPEEISGQVAVNRIFDNAIRRTERSFQKNVGAITLTPELSDEERQRLVEKWKENTHDSVNRLVRENIQKIRARVSDSVNVGTRYSNLVRGIQHESKVSVGRAKLIARQESKALVNSYAEERYADAGVEEYYWVCVHGTAIHPVRPRHQALADASKRGVTYRFDDPPVVTEPGEPERRANPGFDFFCRCKSVPVVKFGAK